MTKKRKFFRDRWKDYFNHQKRERRGVYALLLILLIVISYLFIQHFIPREVEAVDYKQWEKEVDSFYASLKKDTADKEEQHYSFNELAIDKRVYPKKKTKKPHGELFTFNPNNLPESEWRRLGFSERQIHGIKNYEEKGGKFRTKEDVKKMYSISDEQYARIEPYIDIPPQARDTTHPEFTYKKKEYTTAIVDIGTADTLELTKLRGIGASYARRIFKYREMLGGFCRKEQLLEVWNFPDSLYQFILPNITINDSTSLRKININSIDTSEFHHPYIRKKIAFAIINYHKQHGAFTRVEDILKTTLVDAELYRKLAPYLKTE